MTSTNIIIIAVIAIVGIGLLVFVLGGLYGRAKAKKMGADWIFATHIIWAAQGPFKTKVENIGALFVATQTVMGNVLGADRSQVSMSV